MGTNSIRLYQITWVWMILPRKLVRLNRRILTHEEFRVYRRETKQEKTLGKE